MTRKHLAWVAVVLVAAVGALWAWRGAALWHTLSGSMSGTMSAAPPVRKCAAAARGAVVYTQEACPEGTREVSIDGGAVTVLPAPPVLALPKVADDGASRATLRDLLVPPDGIDLRERQIERALDR